MTWIPQQKTSWGALGHRGAGAAVREPAPYVANAAGRLYRFFNRYRPACRGPQCKYIAGYDDDEWIDHHLVARKHKHNHAEGNREKDR